MASYNNMWLVFMGIDGEVTMQKKLTTLPIREDVLIRKSIEFFNDPEPCMIHRSAVMKRIYYELGDYLDAMLSNNIKEVDWVSVPEPLKEPLNVKDGTVKLGIKLK